jgi:hypothetical protein
MRLLNALPFRTFVLDRSAPRGHDVRILTVVNSEASRVEAALSEIAAWFEENCEAAYVRRLHKMNLRTRYFAMAQPPIV